MRFMLSRGLAIFKRRKRMRASVTDIHEQVVHTSAAMEAERQLRRVLKCSRYRLFEAGDSGADRKATMRPTNSLLLWHCSSAM
jgi:hypothetical protein